MQTTLLHDRAGSGRGGSGRGENEQRSASRRGQTQRAGTTPFSGGHRPTSLLVFLNNDDVASAARTAAAPDARRGAHAIMQIMRIRARDDVYAKEEASRESACNLRHYG
ncbi:hypothetical protein CG433_15745 [Pantoea ananatis]|nr:hypothetical protein CG433_15745 [Pantoea ananatis]